MRRLALALVAAGTLMLTTRESAAQSCTVKMYTVNFGTVVPGRYAVVTNFEANCQGDPGKTVRVCVTLPPNSDGKYRLYNAARTGQILTDYRDAQRNSIAQGPWTMDVVLSAAGSGMVRTPVEVAISPTTDYNLPPGLYQSAFSATPFGAYAYLSTATCQQTSGWKQDFFNPPVSATLDPICYVVTRPLDFGTQTLQTDAVASTTVTVSCDAKTAYTLTLDFGRNNGTGPTDRRLANGSNVLKYGLYRDSTARSQPWGNTVATGVTGAGTGTHTIYGRIPVQPGVPPGTYSDIVQLTITY